MGLTLRLLGSPEVILDGEPATGFVSDKARALLFYLAMEADRAQRRETLAGLLWPDYPERSARTNLSNALSNLRTVLADRGANDVREPYLLVSRETIQFNAGSDYWLDTRAFDERVKHAPVKGQQGEKTVTLYRGRFLEGFSLSDSPAFEQWALIIRERLQQQMGVALKGLGATYEELGDYARAQTIARRQLELEPWHEGAHRALMRALALSGERASALAQYEACAQTLEQELGAAPSPETAALYEQIRDGGLTSEGAESRREARTDLPRHNLPARITSFIGRERELSQLTAQITDPETRLVTVVGPGGMGKTRLALEVARRQLASLSSSQAAPASFPAGAWLVELSPVGDPDGVPLAVASALGARPQQGRELADILLDAAFIVTPHAYHHDQAQVCLEAGLDVLLEKPMVMNAAEARSLIETRDRTGRLLVVAFPGSLSPQIRTAVSMLRSGELGSLLSISATVWQGWGPGTAGKWRQQPEISGGGFSFDTGAHMLNTVADLAGEDFVQVAAWLDNYGRPVDTLAAIIGRLESGVLVTLHGCGETIPSCASDVRVFCTRAILHTDVWGKWLNVQRHGHRQFRAVPVPPSSGVWEQFLAVREGRIANPCPPEVGLRMARLWDAIKASAAQDGLPVRCD